MATSFTTPKRTLGARYCSRAVLSLLTINPVRLSPLMSVAKPLVLVWVAVLASCSGAPGVQYAARIATPVGEDREYSRLEHVVAVANRPSPVIVTDLEPAPARFENSPPPEARQVTAFPVTEAPGIELEPEAEPVELGPEPPVVGKPEGAAARLTLPAERLRPRVGDWRLWRRPAARTDGTPVQIGERLHAKAQAYSDRLAAAEARWLHQLDWTIGEEGNKWAVSAGKLHLGSGTLPLPLNLEAEPFVQREAYPQAGLDANRREPGQSAIRVTLKDGVRAHFSYAPPQAPPSTS